MTIEQTIMRVIKVSGGLTTGRGVNKEGLLARWILGMPIAYEVMDALEIFCGVRGATSEQHTDWRPSNISRDNADYLRFIEWVSAHDHFTAADPAKIMSIADGMCGGKEVNCDQAIEIGLNAMKTMVGVNAADLKLKRTIRVKSLATTKRGVMLNDEIVAVNITLLFQRITADIKGDRELAVQSLHHELAPFPLALFDDNGIMRKSKKSDLYKEFKSVPLNAIDLTACRIVIDGGFLLHKVGWPLGTSYEGIFKLYENYILRHYGAHAIVVFDGHK
ncbi:uncharacterized protein LOC107046332 [Diachasma alloeum]|uniref:uncharacterized protein LOC107046332 n=1 Tax=Diachasma alloeum TaxID=454923 RepID=UPI0007384271|nr:uncharacterized protein LOC107046332 [Diachasma alloeum]